MEFYILIGAGIVFVGCIALLLSGYSWTDFRADWYRWTKR